MPCTSQIDAIIRTLASPRGVGMWAAIALLVPIADWIHRRSGSAVTARITAGFGLPIWGAWFAITTCLFGIATRDTSRPFSYAFAVSIAAACAYAWNGVRAMWRLPRADYSGAYSDVKWRIIPRFLRFPVNNTMSAVGAVSFGFMGMIACTTAITLVFRRELACQNVWLAWFLVIPGIKTWTIFVAAVAASFSMYLSAIVYVHGQLREPAPDIPRRFVRWTRIATLLVMSPLVFATCYVAVTGRTPSIHL